MRKPRDLKRAGHTVAFCWDDAEAGCSVWVHDPVAFANAAEANPARVAAWLTKAARWVREGKR